MSKYVLEFELEGLPKMTNTLRKHWRFIQRERKEWKERVKNAVLLEQKRAAFLFKPLTRASVIITRFSSREPDFDGLVSSGKALLDGLVEAQVIVDDTQKVIGQPNYLWEQSRPGKGKIKIRVEEK